MCIFSLMSREKHELVLHTKQLNIFTYSRQLDG